jgi:hypothetical protein
MNDSWLIKTFDKAFSGYTPSRVGELVKVADLTISTVAIDDVPDADYETAIGIDDHFYPVERYTTLEQAQAGHQRWIDAAPTLKSFTRIGIEGVEDETIVLDREGPD